jgi:hypothetical protein
MPFETLLTALSHSAGLIDAREAWISMRGEVYFRRVFSELRGLSSPLRPDLLDF